jgi:hypothetical protein
MKDYKKAIIVTLISASLTACGGGGSSSEPVTVTPATPMSIGGKVIDGYIAGATVYLDINFNGELDADEPSTTTDSEGGYVLDIVAEYQKCADYVPVITHVPVGAIDLDFPGTPIEEAYDMVSAPQFTLTSDDDIINLTPLTTVVWKSVEQELKTVSRELSCNAIVANQSLRDDIVDRLTAQEIRVARRYNITVDVLYSDYVLEGNDSLHGLAQALVPGLQASYSDTLELESANPDADFKYVEFYLQLIDEAVAIYGEQNAYWLRKEFIQPRNGNHAYVTNLMSYDLTTREATYERISQKTTNQKGIELERMVRLSPIDDWTPNNQVMTCGVSDRYATVINHREYAVSNNIYSAADWDWGWGDCNSMRHVEHSVTQTFIVADLFTDGSNAPENKVSLSFYEGNINYISEIAGIGSNVSTISPEWLVSTLSFINPDYYSEEGYGSDYWYRLNNLFDDSEQIVKIHDIDDNYTVTTYHADGTNSKQCGTWSGGEASLVDCTE